MATRSSAAASRSGRGPLAAALLAAALAGCAGAPMATQTRIAGLERELAAALGRGDVSTLQRLFADDCRWILPDGTVLTKAEALAWLRSSPSPYRRIEAVDVQVRLFGTTALARGVDRWERGDGQAVAVGRFVWSDTWLRRGGRWQIVQVQDAELPGD